MSDNKFDIGIIGAGGAGSFAALRIAEKYPDVKAICFDIGRPWAKRRRFLEGALGCLPTSDGKLYPAQLNTIRPYVDGRKLRSVNTWVMDHLETASGGSKLVKASWPVQGLLKKFKSDGFSITSDDYYQWKPESFHQLSKNISESLESNPQIAFSFDNEVYRIVKKKGGFVVSSSAGDFLCKKIILAAGRSGWRWVSQLYKDLGLVTQDNIAKFGVRVELAGQYVKEFNKSPCTIIKDDLELGPMSWRGTIIPEDHADLVISTFRSNEDRWKSEKMSFSLVKNVSFPGQGVYQADRLAKLAFLLFNDRVSKEKIKIFMKKDSQLNLIPEYQWLGGVFEELNYYIPNLLNRGYLYVPHIIPQPAQINLTDNFQTEIDGMYAVGESAGFYGIISAAIMGGVAAEAACF